MSNHNTHCSGIQMESFTGELVEKVSTQKAWECRRSKEVSQDFE